MSLVISVIVFSAIAVLLSRTFSVWFDATGRWKLAQHARVARTRMLYGGFGSGTGLLSSTNVSVGPYGGWEQIVFYPVATNGYQHIYGWTGTAPQNIWLKRQLPTEQWAFAQTVSKYMFSETPDVMADDFDAVISNDTLTLTYTLSFSSGGRTYEQPQIIQAYLVNE